MKRKVKSLLRKEERRIKRSVDTPAHLFHTILTIIFPPVGLYYSWKQKVLDHVLPKFVITYSIIFFINSLPMYGAPLNLPSLNPEKAHLSIPLFIAVSLLLLLCVVSGIMGYLHLKLSRKGLPIPTVDKILLTCLITGVVSYNIILSLFITNLTYVYLLKQIARLLH